MNEILTEHGDGSIRLRVKAVPGAKNTQIAGVLGDRLKVRISAPPEGGKANKAICQLLARTLGISKRDVEVVAGRSSPEKVVAVQGIELAQVSERLSLTSDS